MSSTFVERLREVGRTSSKAVPFEQNNPLRREFRRKVPYWSVDVFTIEEREYTRLSCWVVPLNVEIDPIEMPEQLSAENGPSIRNLFKHYSGDHHPAISFRQPDEDEDRYSLSITLASGPKRAYIPLLKAATHYLLTDVGVGIQPAGQHILVVPEDFGIEHKRLT